MVGLEDVVDGAADELTVLVVLGNAASDSLIENSTLLKLGDAVGKVHGVVDGVLLASSDLARQAKGSVSSSKTRHHNQDEHGDDVNGEANRGDLPSEFEALHDGVLKSGEINHLIDAAVALAGERDSLVINDDQIARSDIALKLDLLVGDCHVTLLEIEISACGLVVGDGSHCERSKS